MKVRRWSGDIVPLICSLATRQEESVSVPPNLPPAKYPRGPGSSVGIATGYGLNGPGIESQWGVRFSASVHTSPGARPASYTMGTGAFSVGRKRPGHDTDPSPPSIAEV
jgi:hypothetical protein